jgi:hypothetical protein
MAVNTGTYGPLKRQVENPPGACGESACPHRDAVEWSCWLLVDLSQLALIADLAHGYHVFAHTLPEKVSRYHLFGSLYARVGHTVDSVEDYSPVSHWDKWPEDAM